MRSLAEEFAPPQSHLRKTNRQTAWGSGDFVLCNVVGKKAVFVELIKGVDTAHSSKFQSEAAHVAYDYQSGGRPRQQDQAPTTQAGEGRRVVM